MKLENILYLVGGVGIVYALTMNSKFKKKEAGVARTGAVVSEQIIDEPKILLPSDKVQPPAPYNPNLPQFTVSEVASFDGLTQTSKEILNNEPIAISAVLYRGVM
jgi:hypothetical protein